MKEYVDIQGNYYGKTRVDKNGNQVFQKYGRAAFLSRVFQPLDNQTYDFELQYAYGMQSLTTAIPRGDLSDTTACRSLENIGLDVDSSRFACFARSVFMQEEVHIRTIPCVYSYEHLGWLVSQAISSDGTDELCFRASQLITANDYIDSVYKGNYKVDPTGTYAAWRDMVRAEVLPYVPMSIVLLCALSAVVAGLLADEYPIGNGILHLNAVSSAGKSNAAMLAVSTAGPPFTVVKQERDIYGNIVERQSLLQSFSATENALIGRLTGNVGIPVVIDELGKYRGKDMTSLVYDLYDGNGKARMNKDGKVSEQPGFRGTIITIGEFSLLKKCNLKLEGLRNRVLEMKDCLTVTAAHSDAIKQGSVKYNGRAVPRLAHHVIQNGGISYLCPIYERWRATLREVLPKVAFGEKFIDNFPALYLTTAEISKDALKLEFDIEGVIEYFTQYLADGENDMQISARSYEYLVGKFNTNSHRFYQVKNSNEIETHGEIWGRYSTVTNKKTHSGKVIVGEYSVYPQVVEQLLEEGQYSFGQCVAAWKRNEQLNFEKGRNTRLRKIDMTKEAVDLYVFRVFAQEADTDE